MASEALVVALAAILIWVVSGTAEKELSKVLGGKRTSFIIMGGGVLIVAVVYLFYFSTQISLFSIACSVGSGIAFAAAGLLYYKALEKEEVSISYSIGLFQPAIIFTYSILVLSENISTYTAVSGFIVLIGVLLIATKHHLRFDKKLAPVFAANVLWAVYWILLSQAIIPLNQIAMPLLISRAVASLLIIALYERLITSARGWKISARKVHHIIALGIAVGILDGAGNIFYSYLVVLKALAIGSIVTVLGPFFVVLLAYLVYKEKITRIQAAGLVIAAIGAIALALA